jgi:signal transduction histidine kinase
LSDSINRVRQTAKNEFAKIRYDSKIANQEKLRYKNQKEQILFWSLLLIFLGLLGFLFFTYRSRLQLKQTVYKTETRIAKQLHDELANDVYQVMTFAETQDLQTTEKKEHLLEHLDHIYTRTRNISQQNSEIPIDGRYKDALLDLLNSFSSEKVNVMLTNSQDIDWLTIRKTTKIALYRVLQELMVNMKKHSQCSLVVLRFGKTKTHLEISYADNGLGIPDALISKKGLQNVENRITDIKGTITFDSETGKGFKVAIRLPK